MTNTDLNNTDYNDQGSFGAVIDYFVVPVDGTYLLGATLLYKINVSATTRNGNVKGNLEGVIRWPTGNCGAMARKAAMGGATFSFRHRDLTASMG